MSYRGKKRLYMARNYTEEEEIEYKNFDWIKVFSRVATRYDKTSVIVKNSENINL